MDANVVRVVDGDTIRVEAAIWIGLSLDVAVRLDGVDAPEIGGARCPRERVLGRRAKAFAARHVADGVALRDVRRGKYAGRVVARVLAADGRDLGAALLAAGLARPYGANKSWCG
ncbi:MAG: thermonuclease family protein [Parvularculaceae bacterium]